MNKISKILPVCDRFLIIFAIILVVLFSLSLNSAEINSTNTDIEDSKSAETVNNLQQGFKAHIDPDTGELISRPGKSPDSIPENNSVNGIGIPDFVQPGEIPHPDGGATVVMPDAFQHSTRIEIDESGKKTVECVRKHEHDHK